MYYLSIHPSIMHLDPTSDSMQHKADTHANNRAGSLKLLGWEEKPQKSGPNCYLRRFSPQAIALINEDPNPSPSALANCALQFNGMYHFTEFLFWQYITTISGFLTAHLQTKCTHFTYILGDIYNKNIYNCYFFFLWGRNIMYNRNIR